MPSIECSRSLLAIIIQQRSRLLTVGYPAAGGSPRADRPPGREPTFAGPTLPRPHAIPARRPAGCRSAASNSSSASACGNVRGKPSNRQPAAQSGCSSRRPTIARMTRSGTRSPRSMYCLAANPSGVRCSHRLPQHVAGRQVRNFQIRDQPLGLGSFAGTGRTNEDYPHGSSGQGNDCFPAVGRQIQSPASRPLALLQQAP